MPEPVQRLLVGFARRRAAGEDYILARKQLSEVAVPVPDQGELRAHARGAVEQLRAARDELQRNADAVSAQRESVGR